MQFGWMRFQFKDTYRFGNSGSPLPDGQGGGLERKASLEVPGSVFGK